ncbi:hypothetical protein K2X92_01360 [Candidatus Gracilibacteria bacterium]|nr:hypothetical protein [Candidatus Gracilibacteria bacterium]
MEGLFFVINQVWILHSMNVGYFILSIILGYGIYRLYIKKKLNIVICEKPNTIGYTPVDTNDSRFIEKTLLEIRSYLSKKYLPEHTWAHTPNEIKKYITDPSLIQLIKELEHKEYTGLIPDSNETKSINTQLIKLLQ